MIAAYTVCSANDLARAKTLIASLSEHEPSVRLYIGLTDKADNRFTHAELAPATIIEAADVGLAELEQMSAQYSITELNCAMKSFFGDHLLKIVSPDKLLYFDTDIFIYRPLQLILDTLDQFSLALTPHILSPIPPDEKVPRERNMLAAGLYNGGFIGFKNDNNTREFFQWWKARMKDQAYVRPGEGMFYDQNWLNFVPLYFSNVTIIKDAGHNVAYWNLHERRISRSNEGYKVNDVPLTFFHFSGLDPNTDNLSKHQDRYKPGDLPIVDELLVAYRTQLKNNRFAEFSQLICAYGKKQKQHSASKKILMDIFTSLGYQVKKLPK